MPEHIVRRCSWPLKAILPHFQSDESRQKFWDSVKVRSPDECWKWLGSINRGGYGTTSRSRRSFSAHRVSLTLKLGREIKHGFMACHKCDNRACVNPRHLWEGTASDNLVDAFDKERRSRNPVAANAANKRPRAILTEAQVLEILGSRETPASLSRQFGITAEAVRRIRRGVAWKHISRPYQEPRLSPSPLREQTA